MRVFLAFCLLFAELSAQPWLGNWLEFVAKASQRHTQSRMDHKKLYQDKTFASLEFMPDENLSAELELDLAKTQKHSYGFDSAKAGVNYRLLNDLISDPITLTVGIASSLSTPARVKDLSSNQHGVFDTEARLAFGREFIIHEESYYKAWGLLYTGIASSGSPWIGLEAHLGRVFSHEKHAFDLFFRAEKGTSHHKLNHHFHSYSRIGYQYEELGLSYTLKEVGLASFYAEATYRLRARFCPKDAWSARLGVVIPFSPW